MFQELKISDIKVRHRHRKDMGDLKSLAVSIRQEGLLQPIGVTKKLELVFGERRILATRNILKKKTILARIVDVTSILAGEYAENEIRKNFTPSVRVAIAKAIEKQVGNRQGQRTELRGIIPEVAQGQRTREVAAERAGFGNDKTYRQAAKVVQNGSANLIRAMDEGRVSISAASILIDADDSILELDEKAILQAAKEIRLHRGLDGSFERSFRGLTNDWLTPPHILKALGKFDLDPCASLHQKSRTAARRFTIKDDGLRQVWAGRVWCNPPYGEQTVKWLEKKWRSMGMASLSSMLAPRQRCFSTTCGTVPAGFSFCRAACRSASRTIRLTVRRSHRRS
jgi:ParB family chromosome partitioning protein